MKIKQFIEKTIEGGFIPEHRLFKNAKTIKDRLKKLRVFEESFVKGGDGYNFFIKYVVLDPKAWQAVGRVEGWVTMIMHMDVKEVEREWEQKMHQMIDALCKGKSLVDFIKEL